ncbi:hypothetical protein MMM139_01170 [Helicobacter pylori]
MVFVGFKNIKGVFYNQNKRAKRTVVSHNALLLGLGGFSFGGELFQNTPYLLMSFKNPIF